VAAVAYQEERFEAMIIETVLSVVLNYAVANC
jgi:hypothetical protein